MNSHQVVAVKQKKVRVLIPITLCSLGWPDMETTFREDDGSSSKAIISERQVAIFLDGHIIIGVGEAVVVQIKTGTNTNIAG